MPYCGKPALILFSLVAHICLITSRGTSLNSKNYQLSNRGGNRGNNLDKEDDKNSNVNERKNLRVKVKEETAGSGQSQKEVYSTSEKSPEQSVLCDIALSIPAVLSYKTNNWDCSVARSNSSYCTWQGITCSTDRTITGISILSASLGTTSKSTIPTSLSTLSSLKLLSLKACSLRGPIPSSLSILTKLNQIILSSNLLTGNIPNSFKNLISLQTLYIDNNALVGTLPNDVLSMPNLLYLDVSLNKFHGKFPALYGMTVKTVKSVSTYYVQDKVVRGRVGSDSNSENESGSWSGDYYQNVEKDYSMVERVEQMKMELDLEIPEYNGENNEHFSDPFVLDYEERNENNNSNNDNLKMNNVYNRRKYNENSENNVKEEKKIEKDNNNIGEINYDNGIYEDQGGGGEEVGEREEEGEIEGDSPEERELKSLQFYYSPPVLYNPIPLSDIGLRYLSLYANLLTGTLPSFLSEVTTLKEIHLSYNSFTGTIPSGIGAIFPLQSLSLQWNSFIGTIPSSLGMLSNLLVLKLFTNRLVEKNSSFSVYFFLLFSSILFVLFCFFVDSLLLNFSTCSSSFKYLTRL
jgi:Leucine-rich repeat (LRR) protein